MSAPLHFPNTESMRGFLSGHPLLTNPFYKELGITQAIARLAAARFADSAKWEVGVRTGTMHIIKDLRGGMYGLKGQPVPNFKMLVLPREFWDHLHLDIERALIDCATQKKAAL